MNKLLKKTLVFIISVAMIFTTSAVSFATVLDTDSNYDGQEVTVSDEQVLESEQPEEQALEQEESEVQAFGAEQPEEQVPESGEPEVQAFAEDTDVAFQVTAGSETVDITVGDMKAVEATVVTEEAPWYFNSTSKCFGTFYQLKAILTNKGIDTADITGISAFASDGFISSYADSDVDNIYVFDMSEVSRNGSYGAEGTYGAGLYTEDGSAAGNKWPTNIVNITMAQATDFAEAAIGSKYYATLENALAATGKGGSTCDITMLRSKELTDAAIDTAKTKSIDLNGFNLTGTATITGANGIEIKDTAETAGVMGLTITASEFTGEITNSLAKYEMANNDGVYTFTRITTPIDAAVITGLAAKTYTGAAIKPVPTVKLGDTVLTAGTDYSVAYANNVNAGTAIVTITGQGNYSGTATATFQINKANQKMTVKANTKTLKVKKLKKKARTVSAITATKQGGALSYSGVGTNAKSKKALKINAKTGKITVKKKTKKGTYKMKVTVRSAASTNYNAASKVVTVTIKVKK